MRNKCTSKEVRPSKAFWWLPKIKTISSKRWVMYRPRCGRVEYDDWYIGESRTFEEKFKGHLKLPFPIYAHCNTTGHSTTTDNISTAEREDHNLTRTIIESIHIWVNNPSLNKNISKYHLPHIWDGFLLNTSGLKFK